VTEPEARILDALFRAPQDRDRLRWCTRLALPTLDVTLVKLQRMGRVQERDGLFRLGPGGRRVAQERAARRSPTAATEPQRAGP
jgi:hypothetical protein